MWRGGCRLNISVAASFVWRCLSGSAMAPFPHPAHRTGHADFPHPALGQDFTPSPSARRAQAGTGVRAQVPVKVREWISSALASPDLVLEAQPPAQPHSGVVVMAKSRPIKFSSNSPQDQCTSSGCAPTPMAAAAPQTAAHAILSCGSGRWWQVSRNYCSFCGKAQRLDQDFPPSITRNRRRRSSRIAAAACGPTTVRRFSLRGACCYVCELGIDFHIFGQGLSRSLRFFYM